ncbi:MAG: type II secretion system major pseudopilin GspG [Opitutales bacterium]
MTTISHNKFNRSGGFSLIEILIVIALIAILVTVTIGNLDNVFGGQQTKVADIFVNQTAKIGLTPYKLDVGNYPTTEEGLEALVRAPAGKESRWRGPYLEEVPLDPWKQAYRYRYPGSKNINGARGYDVWSLGPDGTESADDIGNWKN